MQSEFDVLIVGAGLSGIAAAYHFQDQNPELSYAILEGRPSLGGTWDLFRYPGVRSDSDMYTLGYSFRPWKEAKAIADGSSILRYINETAKEFGIDRHIRRNHKVGAAEWASEEARWTVSVEQTETGETFKMRCRFLVLCCGYYDYDQGYTPDYPGLRSFQGEFIHPQKWDQKSDYADKRVVVIGSGATAVTLVPELAKKAKHVVMLQRSPSYLASLPSVDGIAEFLKKTLPTKISHWLIRWKNILGAFALFRFCRRFPNLARSLLLHRVSKAIHTGKGNLKDFSPAYGPWEQRVCFVPDGDFFDALNSGKVEIFTDTLAAFTETGLKLSSGRELAADIVVSATGLKLKFLGGISLRVDGRSINVSETVPYKGAMLSGVPNLGMAFGYTNASWTLKCDLVCDWLSRIIHHMHAHRYDVVMPEANPVVERAPMVDFSSGYFQRAKDILPRQGTKKPWKLNQNYFADLIAFRAKSLKDEGLRFVRASERQSLSRE